MTVGKIINQASGSCTGDANTRVLQGVSCRSVLLHNTDGANSLWIMFVNVGESEPTVSATSKIMSVPPGETVELNVNTGQVDLWVKNSSGGSTSSTFYYAAVDGESGAG